MVAPYGKLSEQGIVCHVCSDDCLIKMAYGSMGGCVGLVFHFG